MPTETVEQSPRRFNPHAAARAEALSGTVLASFPSRMIAFGIDILLAAAIYGPLEIGVRYVYLRWKGLPIDIHIEIDFHNVSSVLCFLLYFGLSLYWANGRTIGKWLMKIRVVSLTHERISFWQSIERALGYGASALEFGFGFLQYFINPNRCCVHDRIAETIVVKEPLKE